MRNWRNCGPISGGTGNRGKGSTNYEVLLTDIVYNSKKDGWKSRCISFTFRNKGADRISDHNAHYLRISDIQPNTTRIYFDLLSDDFNNRTIGRKLVKDGNAYSAKFPYLSEHERKVITGRWIGEYELKYDADWSSYYIENKATRGWRL